MPIGIDWKKVIDPPNLSLIKTGENERRMYND